MAAGINKQVVRELVRLMKDKSVRTKDKLEAARLIARFRSKQASSKRHPVPEKQEPSSLE